MADLLLSDLHLLGDQDPLVAELRVLLLEQSWDRVFLLGDVFHFWWGRGQRVDPVYQQTLQVLEQCVSAGTTVHLVPGNHDFAVGEAIPSLGVRVASSIQTHLVGLPCRMFHGDEADRSLGYRVTRRVLRGRGFAALMAGLPTAQRRRLGLHLAGDRFTGEGNSRVLEAQKRWAQAQLGADCRLVVMGHSHTPGLFPLSGGWLLNLGDLCGHRTLAVADESGVSLCTLSEGRPVRTATHLPAHAPHP